MDVNHQLLPSELVSFPSRATVPHSSFNDNKLILSTGNKKLDGFLGGGIKGGEVTEIQGDAKSGKSTLCSSVAINTLLATPYSVLYISSGTSQSSMGIVDSSLIDGLNTITKRIKFFQIKTHEDLVLIIANIRSYLSQQSLPRDLEFYSGLKLIVVDDIFTLMSIFSVREKFFKEVSDVLLYLFKELFTMSNIAVITVNGKVFNYQQSNYEFYWAAHWSNVYDTLLILEFDVVNLVKMVEPSYNNVKRRVKLIKTSSITDGQIHSMPLDHYQDIVL